MIRTAVDTSVLLDVLVGDPVHGSSSRKIMQRCWEEGCLVACDVVWAEVRPRFESDESFLMIVDKMGLGFDPMESEAALLAGTLWKKYRSEGGKRDRMIPDFLIGAHAVKQAHRFLTRDRGFYRKYFKELEILEP